MSGSEAVSRVKGSKPMSLRYAAAALAVTLVAGAASAQTAVNDQMGAGAAPARGNAPIKAAHTVNAGGAKAGHNSFTERQARRHILKSGYTQVSGLTKGPDGVWRGSAMKNGAQVQVALDFKGNVTEGQ